MHITVAGKQVETGEALKVHVADGLSEIARKYFDHAIEARVTFRRNRGFFACDINLHAARGLSMQAEGESTDAHRAFSVAAEHMAKRLRRTRRRMSEHGRSLAEGRVTEGTVLNGGAELTPEESAEADALLAEDRLTRN
ncbi:ribosome-associated translation inhibitor RaiA [Roseomonas sp. OT10]|uniref:ribosome hibernation-promoting factor, HPF/YfiA family n=1 Tax=Roseomonas cutis TaxID=2897332 RepID=UPI001E590723|nr:ribosome-associated translation inhibitor RaiA [Roseomonas sp. OT10]UFN47395.1 ribosome-associated translation inhibitor RaiA [Roseomonas sp. OT10]